MTHVAPGIMVKEAVSAERAMAAIRSMHRPGKFERFVAPSIIGAGLGTGAGYLATPPDEPERRTSNMLMGALTGGGLGLGLGWLRPYRLGRPEFEAAKNKVLMHQNEVKPWLDTAIPTVKGVTVENPDIAKDTAIKLHNLYGDKSLAERVINPLMGFIDEGRA